MSSLCDACGDPGLCCRRIVLCESHGTVPYFMVDTETKLDALVLMATLKHPDEWMSDIGLPFMPVRKLASGNWEFMCPRLTDDGRCGDYENRPNLCRIFEPGYHTPCFMTGPIEACQYL